MGREMPPRPRNTTKVTITLPTKDVEQVDQLATELTVGRSAVVRMALRDYLRRQRRRQDKNAG